MEHKLSSALLEHRPRERSGPVATNRFGFQRTWAFCHLLSLHRTGVDYVLLMEFHDDVVVLDSSTDPQQADFYQVKSRRDGQWNAKTLIKVQPRKPRKSRARSKPDDAGDASDCANGPPRSILGKLLEHSRKFAPYVRSLNLVSNARYDVQLAEPGARAADREQVCLLEFTQEAREEVSRCLSQELAVTDPLPLEKVFLIATGISITDHEKYGAGELASFLDARRPNGRFAVQALYRTLSDEIGRRASSEWEPTSFPDLCRRHGICRDEFERFLRDAESHDDLQAMLDAAKAQLAAEGLPYKALLALGLGWNRYQVEVMDHANERVMELRERVQIVVSAVAQSEAWSGLRDLLVLAEEQFVREHGEPEPPFDRNLLRGAILLEFKSSEARGLSTPDPEPSSKTP